MSEQHATPSVTSARKFGALMAFVLAVLAGVAHYRGHVGSRNISLVIMLVLGGLALVLPSVLIPVERLWMQLGEAMGKVVQPIVLGVIYFLLITPVALFGRLFGRDPLRMNHRPGASYWIDRDVKSIDPESFKHPY